MPLHLHRCLLNVHHLRLYGGQSHGPDLLHKRPRRCSYKPGHMGWHVVRSRHVVSSHSRLPEHWLPRCGYMVLLLVVVVMHLGSSRCLRCCRLMQALLGRVVPPHACNVVDARASLVFLVHGVEPDEILLGVASHLREQTGKSQVTNERLANIPRNERKPNTTLLPYVRSRFLLYPQRQLADCNCEGLLACVGVRETTKLREMLRQSPFPNLARPRRKRRCSSSVQGIPFRRSCSDLLLDF